MLGALEQKLNDMDGALFGTIKEDDENEGNPTPNNPNEINLGISLSNSNQQLKVNLEHFVNQNLQNDQISNSESTTFNQSPGNSRNHTANISPSQSGNIEKQISLLKNDTQKEFESDIISANISASGTMNNSIKSGISILKSESEKTNLPDADNAPVSLLDARSKDDNSAIPQLQMMAKALNDKLSNHGSAKSSGRSGTAPKPTSSARRSAIHSDQESPRSNKSMSSNKSIHSNVSIHSNKSIHSNASVHSNKSFQKQKSSSSIRIRQQRNSDNNKINDSNPSSSRSQKRVNILNNDDAVSQNSARSNKSQISQNSIQRNINVMSEKSDSQFNKSPTTLENNNSRANSRQSSAIGSPRNSAKSIPIRPVTALDGKIEENKSNPKSDQEELNNVRNEILGKLLSMNNQDDDNTRKSEENISLQKTTVDDNNGSNILPEPDESKENQNLKNNLSLNKSIPLSQNHSETADQKIKQDEVNLKDSNEIKHELDNQHNSDEIKNDINMNNNELDQNTIPNDKNEDSFKESKDEANHNSNENKETDPNHEKPTDETKIEEGLEVADHTIVPIISIPKTTTQFSEEELEEKLKRFIKTKGKSYQKLPSEMRSPLFQHIVRRRVDAIDKQNYDEGDQLITAQEKLRRLINKDLIELSNNYEKDALKKRLKDIKELLKDEMYQWDKNLQDIEKKLKEEEDQIIKKQKEELKDFTAFWEDPKHFHEFNKASPYLLQLRRVEKNLALQGDFQGAKQMKKRVEELEKAETLAAQQKATKGMEQAYEDLRRKHQNQLTAHQRLTHKIMMHNENKRDMELQPLIMAIKKLELIQDQKPLPKRGVPVSKSLLVKKKKKDSFIGNDSPPVTTPRTIEKLSRIKINPRSEQLSLRGVETKSFLKKRSKSERPPKIVKKEKKAVF